MTKSISGLNSKLGTSDISSLGNSVTDAISALDTNIKAKGISEFKIFTANKSITYTPRNMYQGSFNFTQSTTGWNFLALVAFDTGSSHVVPISIYRGGTSVTFKEIDGTTVTTNSYIESVWYKR